MVFGKYTVNLMALMCIGTKTALARWKCAADRMYLIAPFKFEFQLLYARQSFGHMTFVEMFS